MARTQAHGITLLKKGSARYGPLAHAGVLAVVIILPEATAGGEPRDLRRLPSGFAASLPLQRAESSPYAPCFGISVLELVRQRQALRTDGTLGTDLLRPSAVADEEDGVGFLEGEIGARGLELPFPVVAPERRERGRSRPRPRR